jgi:hypothetical protein
LNRYRVARAYFELPKGSPTGGTRQEADYRAVRRGSCQHEVFSGAAALSIRQGDTLPVRVHCRKDARELGSDESVLFGLVVSIETAVETSTTVFAEVQQALVQAQALERVQVRPAS